MTLQNKPKIEKVSDPRISEGGGETQDEIEQIMSEIEELQQEMNAAAVSQSAGSIPAPSPSSAASPAGSKKAQPHPLVPPLAVDSIPSDPFADTADEASTAILPSRLDDEMIESPVEAESKLGEGEGDAIEKDVLKEFSGAGDEPWLEETLANLKTEPSQSGAGVLDESVASEELPEESEEILEDGLSESSSDESLASLVKTSLKNEVHKESMSSTPKSKDLTFEQVDEFEKELAAEQAAVEKMLKEETEAESLKIPQRVPGVENSLTPGGSLAMTVQGNISVQLNYGNEGQSVVIQFSQQWVQMKLADGSEFKIPVRKKSA